MADTVTTLRPNAVGSSAAYANVGGAASIAAALADNSDTTYAESSTSSEDTMTISMGTFALPAGAILRQLVVRMRLLAAAGSPFAQYGIGKLSDGFFDQYIGYGFAPSSITTITCGTIANFLQTQTDIDNLTLAIDKQAGSGTLRVYEMYADVYYNQLSVVSAVTLTDLGSTTPTVSWTYSDPEGDAQASYQVKVFRTAQADPTNAAGALWDSGTISGTTTSTVVGTPIDAGAIFVYVRTKDTGNGNWSNWASQTGTIAFTAVVAPTALAAVPDNAGARVHITATYAAPGGTYTAPKGTIERSADGGVTWYHVRIAGVLYPNGYTLPATPYNLDTYDYEAPPGVALQYRVRELASNGAFTVSSAYRTVS